MKTILYHSKLRLSLMIILLLSGLSFSSGATKYALIVAVGNQSENTQWNSTNAHKDANIARKMYQSKGFDSLIVLTDQSATKKAVVDALKQARISLANGDVFVFHYAGHGQRMEDDNQDDIDGLDEALVLYGAPSEYDQWYRDENHLRDDEFSSLVDRIRSKLGENGEVLIVTDAGFGASNDLGLDSIRGGKKAMVSPDFVNRSRFMDISAGIYEDRPFGVPAESFAPIITISAALSHQVAYEYQGSGALTRALERALESLKEEDTYENLYSRLTEQFAAMNISQKPLIDGFYDIIVLRNAKNNEVTRGMSFVNDEVANSILNSDRDLHELNWMKQESDARLRSLF